jgi:hypothetical protein
MEEDYQSALSYLFPRQAFYPGSTAYNPFAGPLENLGGGGGAGEDSGDQSSPSGEDTTGGQEDTSGEGTGNEGDGSSGSSDSGGQGGGQGEPKLYSFLIMGDFESGKTVDRAYRDSDGDFVLESGHRVRLFSSSGIVGVPQESVFVPQGFYVLSTDFSGDGLQDLVLAGTEGSLTFVRGYLRHGVSETEPSFEVSFQNVTIKSLAVFDFERDGSPELAMVFSGNSNLVIYELLGEGLSYSRELVLPFEPAVIVSTQDQGVFKYDYLQVFDENMRRSIAFSSRYPGIYSYSKPPSYRFSESVKVDPANNSGAGDEFMVVQYDDKVLLVEAVDDRFVFMGSFAARKGRLKILVGDYFDDGSRQLIFLP